MDRYFGATPKRTKPLRSSARCDPTLCSRVAGLETMQGEPPERDPDDLPHRGRGHPAAVRVLTHPVADAGRLERAAHHVVEVDPAHHPPVQLDHVRPGGGTVQSRPDELTLPALGEVRLVTDRIPRRQKPARGRPGRLVWTLGWLTAALLALDFAGAVADRFGLLGTAGASWGSWDAFVGYTARLLPFVPDSLVGVAAISATAGEITLAIWLLSGWQRRWAGKAAAGLLTVYLPAMGFAIGITEVARFALPIQIGGALLVSAVPSRRPGESPSAEVSHQYTSQQRLPG
jgi:hypothetical protein